MKSIRFSALAVIVFACAIGCVDAQKSIALPAADPGLTDEAKRTEEKHSKPILEALKLNDASKETKFREIFGAHFKALNEWQARNDAQIKALAEIDGVYASFKPQHENF